MDGKSTKDYEKRLQETLEIIGLTDKQDFYSTQLSGGQQQRVFLARALVQEAEIYFMDEPFQDIGRNARSQSHAEAEY